MSSSSTAPQIFNRTRVAAHRDRAAMEFSQYDFLKQRVSSDIVERLKDTPRRFEHALDLGCHTGELARALEQAGQVDVIEAGDLSAKMVEAAQSRGVSARMIDEENLLIDEASLDLVVSALSLHWVNDLPGTLIQTRRALKPDGLLLAALPGAGTLTELRDAFATAELDILGGVSPRLSPFPALRDMATLLQRTGFALPVADRDFITVRYDSVMKLMMDLKGMGETAALNTGSNQPLSRRLISRLEEVYREKFSDEDGRLPATFEIIHISGWSPSDNQPKPLKPGAPKINLDAAIKNLKKER